MARLGIVWTTLEVPTAAERAAAFLWRPAGDGEGNLTRVWLAGRPSIAATLEDYAYFADGLLDCPHYTRPEVIDGLEVPPVLLGGDHAAIRRWRSKQALGRTWQRRPDLLGSAELDEEQRVLLEEFIAEQS